MRCLSTRSCGRRPKSANERNRGNGYVGTPRALRRIEPRAKPGNRGHMARKRVQLRRDGMSIAIWGKYLLGPLRFQRIRRGKKDTRDNLHAMSLHLALGNDNHKAHRSSIEETSTSHGNLQPKLFSAARQVIRISHLLWTSPGSGALLEMLILARSCGRIGCLIRWRRLEPNR